MVHEEYGNSRLRLIQRGMHFLLWLSCGLSSMQAHFHVMHGSRRVHLNDVVDFGFFNLTDSPVTNHFYLTNNSVFSPYLGDVVVKSDHPRKFQIIGDFNRGISPGASIPLAVVYHPRVTGEHEAVISINWGPHLESYYEFKVEAEAADLRPLEAYVKASAPGLDDEFGAAVAISGDRAAVGARFVTTDLLGVNGEQTNSVAIQGGAVYTYVREGTNWSFESFITPTNPGSFAGFGTALALDGNRMVVGAPGSRDTVYVYEHDGSNWLHQAELIPQVDESDSFGRSLDIEGNVIVVGAPAEDGAGRGVGGDPLSNGLRNSGAAYVFHRTAGDWTQVAYLKSSAPARSAAFGSSVALQGALIAVGAPFEHGLGAAYVFSYTNGMWQTNARLVLSNAVNFGATMDFGAGFLAIGAPEMTNTSDVLGDGGAYDRSGAAFIWEYLDDWVLTHSLLAVYPFAGDQMGTSLAASGNTVVLGAPFDNSATKGLNADPLPLRKRDSGAVIVFSQRGDEWAQRYYIKPHNPDEHDYFGSAVGIDGNSVMIGAPNEDSFAPGLNGDAADNSRKDAGASYIFRLPPGDPAIAILGKDNAVIPNATNGVSLAAGTDFGSHIVGSTTVTNFFTITNRGDLALLLGRMHVTGPGAPHFTVRTLYERTVPPEWSTTFSVEYRPDEPGVHAATIRVLHNEDRERPYVINVVGEGFQVSDIAVYGNGHAITNGDHSVILLDGTDFGAVDVSSGLRLTNWFDITNVGTINLSLGAIRLEGLTSTDFALESVPLVPLLSPGGGARLAVSFSPTAVGIRRARVIIPSNDPDENPFTFSVQGWGDSDADLRLFGNGSEIPNLSPAPVVGNGTEFGATPLNGVTRRTFTITNAGSETLTLAAPGFAGLSAASFSVAGVWPTNIAPGSSATFALAFRPAGVSVHRAQLEFLNNDASDTPFVLLLGGSGAPVTDIAILGNGFEIPHNLPALAGNGTDFGALSLGVGSRTNVFVITNRGSTTIQLNGANLIGSSEFRVLDPVDVNLVPGGFHSFRVAYDSGSAIATAQLHIPNSAASPNPYVLNLVGRSSSAPVILVEPRDEVFEEGSSAYLEVLATGADLSHEWRHNGQLVAGGHGPRLSFANVVSALAGSYQVVISNLSGSVTSRVATVSVVPPDVWPEITEQPRGGTNVFGSFVLLSATTAGAHPLFHQWFRDGVSLVGRTQPQLSLFNLQAADSGDYTLVVTNQFGAATSHVARLDVLAPQAPLITRQPLNQNVAIGQTIFLRIEAHGVPTPAFAWIKDGFQIPGAVAAALTITNARSADSGAYTVLVVNSAGNAVSDAAIVNVAAPPVIQTPPSNVVARLGGPLTLHAVAVGAPPITYFWRVNNAIIGSGSPLHIPEVSRTHAGAFSVIASNFAGATTSAEFQLRLVVPQRFLAPQRLPNGRLRFRFGDVDDGAMNLNRLHQLELQSAPELNGGWARLGNTLQLLNGVVEFEDVIGTSNRFYRVLER